MPRRDLPHALPRSLPKGLAPGWTGPEEGWPPRLRGVTDLQLFDLRGAESGFTEEEVAHREEILQIALNDPRVRTELGDRFVHVDTDEMELPKGKDSPILNAIPMRLTFYSHSHNVAVQVTVAGCTVNDVMRKPGYQPPEAEDEIRRAIDIARSDSKLADSVLELEANAILAAPDPDHIFTNPRVLYVHFSRSDEYLPRVGVAVDLINERVISIRHCGSKQEGESRDGTSDIVE